jgi:hypothetical protein
MFTCRICHEEEVNTKHLISPCKCDGSCRYVHLSCLNVWRTFQLKPFVNEWSTFNDTSAWDSCGTCHYRYKYKKDVFRYTISSNHEYKQYYELFETGIIAHTAFIALFFVLGYCTYLVWHESYKHAGLIITIVVFIVLSCLTLLLLFMNLTGLYILIETYKEKKYQIKNLDNDTIKQLILTQQILSLKK